VAIDREKVLLAAQGFIQRKRYDRAVLEYQKIIQQDPDDARTLLKIGDLQSKMEAHADAVATYERVGRHYASQGFALKAIAVYKQIREIIQKHVPDLADRYSHITPQLADLYAQLGLVSDALAAYDDVATHLQRTGQEVKAVEVFKKIVALDNTNPLAHLRLAEAYSRIKQVDEAIKHFGTAAEILIRLKRSEDALKVLERLLHHRAEPHYARRAADIYLERGRANDGMLALAKLQICFQADQKNLHTLATLARAFVVIGQPAKSIEVQKELARAAKEQGNAEVYRDTVSRLLDLAPNDDQVLRLAAASGGIQVAPAKPESDVPAPITESEIEELSEDDLDIGQRESTGAIAAAGSAGAMADPRPPLTSAPELDVIEPGDLAVDPFDQYAAFDPALHPARFLADAESFQKVALYDQAIARLEQGIEVHPRSVPLRRKMRDILYEAGEYPATAEQMVLIAGILIEDGDAASAAEELGAILSFAPEHEVARQMLIDLGYELPTDPLAPTGETYGGVEGHYRDAYPTIEGDDLLSEPSRGVLDSVPLPSYDLEEVSAEDAMSSPGYDVGSALVDPRSSALTQARLPSFPIDDEIPTSVGETIPEAAEVAPASVPAAVTSSGASRSEAIEDALEEVEFFMSRGLLDDARAILDEQLRRLPHHPLLVERMHELELAAEQLTASSGTRERPDPAPAETRNSDRAFDIAASLDALDQLDHGAPESRRSAEANTQIDVEEVFAKFKAGVRAQVSETDSATHYDLGLAYREMDLLSDAIDEFEMAGRDPARECVCQSMIGMIHRTRGNVNAAIEAFLKGLHAAVRTEAQETSLYYELGDAYESKANATEALYYFRKIAHRAPNYSDPRGGVVARIRGLQNTGERPSMAHAVGSDEDFDSAFDAALGGRTKG
jgi:tetratricopeptide (TPR) repeat protein